MIEDNWKRVSLLDTYPLLFKSRRRSYQWHNLVKVQQCDTTWYLPVSVTCFVRLTKCSEMNKVSEIKTQQLRPARWISLPSP